MLTTIYLVDYFGLLISVTVLLVGRLLVGGSLMKVVLQKGFLFIRLVTGSFVEVIEIWIVVSSIKMELQGVCEQVRATGTKGNVGLGNCQRDFQDSVSRVVYREGGWLKLSLPTIVMDLKVVSWNGLVCEVEKRFVTMIEVSTKLDYRVLLEKETFVV